MQSSISRLLVLHTAMRQLLFVQDQLPCDMASRLIWAMAVV